MKSGDVSSCIHCGLCTKKCVFLDKYGLDTGTFAGRADLAYSCFLCGTCTDVCPKGIDGARIAQRMRGELVRRAGGTWKDSSFKGLLWEKNPYRFANYRRGKCETVLFPGCNFPSFYPATMKCLEQLMGRHGIGVVYECCQKPIGELGMEEDAAANLGRMEKRLLELGVRELVVLCPNCYHYMKDRVSIPVVTVYEKLKLLEEGRKLKAEWLPVYYPCPDRRGKEMMADLNYFLEGKVKEAYSEVQCCGLGGCAAAREPQLAKSMVSGALGQGEKELYTYCASCISSFRRNGFLRSYHMLPMILGVEEKVPLGVKPFLNRVGKKFL